MVMFTTITRAKHWSELNRDIWLDLLRVFLGVALFLKGVAVLRAAPLYTADLVEKGFPMAGPTLVHYAALAHFIGGTMLVFGIFTRAAAIIQIPNVLGAIFFVHAGSGIFSMNQSLEVAVMTLVLLVSFAFLGSGRLSTDWYFSEHPHQMSAESAEIAQMEIERDEDSASEAVPLVTELSSANLIDQTNIDTDPYGTVDAGSDDDDSDDRITLVDTRIIPAAARPSTHH